jgi:hypothetical protein
LFSGPAPSGAPTTFLIASASDGSHAATILTRMEMATGATREYDTARTAGATSRRTDELAAAEGGAADARAQAG